jgi:hypothetical protein
MLHAVSWFTPAPPVVTWGVARFENNGTVVLGMELMVVTFLFFFDTNEWLANSQPLTFSERERQIDSGFPKP